MREDSLDCIMGCMFGGAIGDALGYPVEFMQESRIFENYGKDGITEYVIDSETKTAVVSDDTQMMLFTANGILFGQTRGRLRGIQAAPSAYVRTAYKEWLATQKLTYAQWNHKQTHMWLMEDPRLFQRRAPGNSCLTALVDGGDYSIQNPANASKGCGGIMRVAPLALAYPETDGKKLAYEGAEIAALTHGHALGYLPAAVLTYMIHEIITSKGEKRDLKEMIEEGLAVMAELFAGDVHVEVLEDIVRRAIRLAENDKDDRTNIHALGEGWVAEETLAIAVYCSLKYKNDFSKGIIASVNHNGDSDSTGCVTGNILGAYLGYAAIDNKWKDKLELSDVLTTISKDLASGCKITEDEKCDPEWEKKYVR